MTKQAGLPAYGDLRGLPPLVARAVEASRRADYDKACLPEVGRLLHLLVASRSGIRIGETGTACGVGAAWLASAMDARSTLATVEQDPGRAAIARGLLAPLPNVETITGDWSLLRGKGPFDLLFIDGGPDKSQCDEILSMLAPHGLVVLDDLTPSERWTAEQRQMFAGGDPVRRAWSERGDCVISELRVTADAAVLLIAKTG